MSLTINDSDRLPSKHINIYLMRIGESSNVWWKSSWMKTDIFLIYFADCENARNIKKLFQLDLFVMCFIDEKNHIYKWRLHKNTVCNDYRRIELCQNLLFLLDCVNDWFNRRNNTEFFTRLWWLLWCDKYNSRNSLKETICRLRMKIAILRNVNESYSSSMIWCWKDCDDRFNWASCELSISWKGWLNSENIYRRNINHKLLKKWKIQIEYRIE